MELPLAAAALAALGQETRLAIFRLLVQEGPEGLTARQIAARLGVPASTLAFHLGQLRQGMMVEVKQERRQQVYAVAYPTAEELLRLLIQGCGGDTEAFRSYPALSALRRFA